MLNPRVIGLLPLVAFLVAAAPSLSPFADTWWSADDGCFITDIAFHKDGTADVFFQDGRLDAGTWSYRGTTVTIVFLVFRDTFSARLIAGRLNATHSWKDDVRLPAQTETCILSDRSGRAA